MHTAILGLSFGDEAKGRMADYFGDKYKYHARFNGGANAGHTVSINGEIFQLHLLPVGILRPDTVCLIGPGCQLDIERLIQEIEYLESKGIILQGRLKISNLCHIVSPWHKTEDSITGKTIGTTGQGIGICNQAKMQRTTAIRIYDISNYAVLCNIINNVEKDLSIKICDRITPEQLSPSYFQSLLKKIDKYIVRQQEIYDIVGNNDVLFEGANGALLDVNFGTFPFVTSNSTTVNAIADGIGYPANNKLYHNMNVVGVFKAYSTRVGEGPFVTEIFDDIATTIRNNGKEFGTTTGRPRRIGWLDLPALKYAISLNNPSCLAMNCLDVLTGLDKIGVCIEYCNNTSWPTNIFGAVPNYQYFDGWKEDISNIKNFYDLPENTQKYVEFIKNSLGVHIKYIGLGRDRDQLIVKPDKQVFWNL